MLNMIQSDLYKMVKSRSFYAITFAFFIITLAIGAVMKVNVTRDYELTQSLVENFSEEDMLSEEEYTAKQEEFIVEQDVKKILGIQYSGITMLIIAMFLAIFICSEFDSGYIKNMIPLENSRPRLLIAKNVVAFIFILIQTIIGLIGAMFSSVLLSGKLNIPNLRELLIYLVFQMILAMTFAALIILLSYFTKSKAAVISIGFLLVFDVQSSLLRFLDNFLNISKMSLTELSIVAHSQQGEFTANNYQTILLIAVSTFIFYNIISLIRLKRLEIN